MALGIAIAPLLHPTLAPAGVGFWPFALFIAAALSITAFPVMARILKDRGLSRTGFGQLSLSAAAVVPDGADRHEDRARRPLTAGRSPSPGAASSTSYCSATRPNAAQRGARS